MKTHKNIKTVDDLLLAADDNGGYLLIKDNFNKFWVIEQLKRVNHNVTVSQTCVHEWQKYDYDKEINTYLTRCCLACNICQRWLTSTGEWNTIEIKKGENK